MTGSRTCLVAVLMMIAGMVWSAQQTFDMRIWTSTKGEQVEAKYVSLDGDRLQLEMPDGAKVLIQLASLAAEDHNVALQLARTAGHISDLGTGAIIESPPGKLPVFADGKYKGYHTVCQTAFYRLMVNANANAIVQILEAGEDVGPPIDNRFWATYKTPDQPETRRRIASFDDNGPAPSLMKPLRPLTLNGGLRTAFSLPERSFLNEPALSSRLSSTTHPASSTQRPASITQWLGRVLIRLKMLRWTW